MPALAPDSARRRRAYSQMMIGVSFPRLAARDLDGREVTLPAGLPGERNVVLIAFRRDQQKLVDSWVPWLEQRAAADPRLRFVELPAMIPARMTSRSPLTTIWPTTGPQPQGAVTANRSRNARDPAQRTGSDLRV